MRAVPAAGSLAAAPSIHACTNMAPSAPWLKPKVCGRDVHHFRRLAFHPAARLHNCCTMPTVDFTPSFCAPAQRV